MSTALAQLLSQSPTLWTLSLAAVIALSAPLGWVFSARYKFRAATIDAETRQKIALREQSRLDRVLEVELDFLTQLTRGMQAELDGQLSAMPALATKPTPAQAQKAA
jgi:hypothetical protein